MTVIDIIEKKRDGHPLTEDEIQFVLQGYRNEQIPDYQVSAWLMAIYFRGMDEQETVTLTRLMRDSGVVLDFSHLPAPVVDKHSTGGVGDKVSLILAPLLAAYGLFVPMISGRSLAHTGGTLDKLDSIPGFKTQLPLNVFKTHVEKIGTCLIGQTEEICPADRRLYALRDVTGTVPSMPLICGSILGKKLAEGLNALVLDVKVGNGAIFSDRENAETLARRLIATASHFNLRTLALLTDMSQPLGNAVGNWVEVKEAIAVLHGKGPDDVRRVTLALGAAILSAAGKISDLNEGTRKLSALLENGAAWEKFQQVVKAQGGDLSVINDTELYPKPKWTAVVKAASSGYIAGIDARTIGHTCMALGAGRIHMRQPVDPFAGISLHKKVGQRVEASEALATLQSSSVQIEKHAVQAVLSSIKIREEMPEIPPLLIALLDESGDHAIPDLFDSHYNVKS